MAATPLLLAVGAGATVGSAFMAMQEHERMRRVAALRAIDKREQDMLAQVGASSTSTFDRPALQRLQEAPPIWVLLVHFGEAQLADRFLGKKLKVAVKYGDRGWSLKRATREILCTDAREGHGPSAAFNENCVFLLRQCLSPRVRLRLYRQGFARWRTVAKQDLLLNLEHTTPFWQEGVWKISTFSGTAKKRLSGSLRIVVEVRPFSLSDLCSHGLNFGRAMPRATLADVADSRQPEMPLLQGEAVTASPEAVKAMQRLEERRQAEDRLRHLREEAPSGETDSEDESLDTRTPRPRETSVSSSASSSEAGSSSEDESTSRSACPNPFHCPR